MPNQVLTEANYRKVMDETLPLGERLAAFAARASWILPLGTKSYTDQINNMIKYYGKLGVVEVRRGPSDRENFPATLEVEQLMPQHHRRRLLEELAGTETDLQRPAIVPDVVDVAEDIDLTDIEKVNRFPHGLTLRR